MNPSRILIVDDELGVLQMTKTLLREAGYDVQTAKDAFEALVLLEKQPFDLLLADLKLPGPSGISLTERVHDLQEHCAVIMFSGNPSREQIIEALRAGVDDFLLKPMSNEQIRQAVGRAILKRKRPSGRPVPAVIHGSQIAIGPLKIDLDEHRVEWHDQSLTLTPTEFCLLRVLAQHVGHSLSPVVLVRECRGYVASDTDARFLLKPHISNLRQKLEQNGRYPRILMNQRNIGFTLKLNNIQ